MKWLIGCVLVVSIFSGCSNFSQNSESVAVTIDSCEIQAVTTDMNLDPFYEQFCSYGNLLILSSAQVDPDALVTAWHIIDAMTGDNVEAIQNMVDRGIRVGIIAENEVVTDMPEYSDLDSAFPLENGQSWNDRARGLGATRQRPLVSGAEEDLLCYDTDRYLGESIFLHEFSHTFKDFGLLPQDRSLQQQLRQVHLNATQQGLWDNTYAISSVEEYWAEGVQSYFDANLEAIPANGIHNAINTREELESYDPELYELIDSAFNQSDYRYNCL